MDKLDKLIEKLKEAKEELNKNVNMSYSAAPNGGGDAMKAEECHADDPKHEAKEKKIAKDMKEKADKLSAMHKGESCHVMKNGQWQLKGGDIN